MVPDSAPDKLKKAVHLRDAHLEKRMHRPPRTPRTTEALLQRGYNEYVGHPDDAKILSRSLPAKGIRCSTQGLPLQTLGSLLMWG